MTVGETDIVIISYNEDLEEEVTAQIGGSGNDIITAISADDDVRLGIVIVGSTALPEDSDDDDSADDHLFGLDAAREFLCVVLFLTLIPHFSLLAVTKRRTTCSVSALLVSQVLCFVLVPVLVLILTLHHSLLAVTERRRTTCSASTLLVNQFLCAFLFLFPYIFILHFSFLAVTKRRTPCSALTPLVSQSGVLSLSLSLPLSFTFHFWV